MSNNKLFEISPKKLLFPFELKKRSSCSFYLKNKTDKHVAFKVKTTNPRYYSVTPNSGVVLPRSTCEVVVTMQAQEETPSDQQFEDKFMIQAVKVGHGVTADKVNDTMFYKKARRRVEETKLGVAFVDSRGIILGNEFLTVEPRKLKFHSVPGKTTSLYIFLENKSKKHVAYKITATNPCNYLTPDSKGVVNRWSTLTLIVTMRAQEETPTDMQCNDKFIVQAISLPDDVKEEEVTYEMFSKEAGHLIEETTLGVTYVSSTITSSPRTRPLLRIPHPELTYRYKSSENMRYLLAIKNDTDNDVAIKLTSENPTNYVSGLGKNVVRPRSTLNHRVVLGARSYDREFKDTITLQSVAVSPIRDKGQVTEEMFRKEAGHQVEEMTLNVKYYDSGVCTIL